MLTRYFPINESGHSIRCKLYCQDLKAIEKVVVFCHGFGGNKDNVAAEKFAERMISKHKETALVTFDWPCHGEDVKKKLLLADCSAYLQLVTEHIRNKFQTHTLYAYATSFGAYLTLKYIIEQENPFCKIALRSPAVNMHYVLSHFIEETADVDKLRKGKEIPVGFGRKIMVGPALLSDMEQHDIQAWDYLPFAEDILILHGTKDETAPFDHAKAFADENLIPFIPIDGADHRCRHAGHMEQVVKHILQFFAF